MTSLAAVVSLLTACSNSTSQSPTDKAQSSKPVPVTVAQAETRTVPVNLDAIGNVEAYATVNIRPQITGELTKVHFQEGAEVKTGDLLFTIDPRPEEAVLRSAKADVKRDQAQLESARLEFERTKKLLESSIASQDEYDKAQANLDALEATVLADQATVSNAELRLDYTSIRSPIDGRTGNLLAKAGNVVKAPDDQLVTIKQIHPIYVTFSVPEQNLAEIRRRLKLAPLPVTVEIPGDDSQAQGELSFVDNAVDQATGTIQLKATCPNTENTLWPGQFVRVKLTLSALTNAVVVPTPAIQTGQDGEFVYVVKNDDSVEARPVQTSLEVDGHTVVQSGIQSGETVVTDGQLRLAPGAKVSINESKPLSASAAKAQS